MGGGVCGCGGRLAAGRVPQGSLLKVTANGDHRRHTESCTRQEGKTNDGGLRTDLKKMTYAPQAVL